MIDFIDFAPAVLNITILVLFVIVQFFLCFHVHSYGFSAYEIISHLFEKISLLIMPVIISVAVFVFYELFILNAGTDFSAVCMFIAYYIVPLAALVSYIVYIRMLFKSAYETGICVKYGRVIFPIAILVILYYIIVVVFHLPFVCISFIIPFFACFYSTKM